MVRRRIAPQPTSRLALWARRIALFSLAATFIAVVVVRSGALDIVPALSTLAGGLALEIAEQHGVALGFVEFAEGGVEVRGDLFPVGLG